MFPALKAEDPVSKARPAFIQETFFFILARTFLEAQVNSIPDAVRIMQFLKPSFDYQKPKCSYLYLLKTFVQLSCS